MQRHSILSAIRKHTLHREDTHPLPSSLCTAAPSSKIYAPEKFSEILQSVGGECIILPKDALVEPSSLRHYFHGHTPCILYAHFGVIENGACWIKHHPNDDRTRYTLPEYLAILLPEDALVPTMHEAYHRIQSLGIEDFGLFLSGPSKTADIEQTLVLGAQGAIVTKVFLLPHSNDLEVPFRDIPS